MGIVLSLLTKYILDSAVKSALMFSVILTSLCAVVSTFVSVVSTSGLIDSKASRHCRAEEEELINKGLRSEINHLKIKCTNHKKGCEWTGELGQLKIHLTSDSAWV